MSSIGVTYDYTKSLNIFTKYFSKDYLSRYWLNHTDLMGLTDKQKLKLDIFNPYACRNKLCFVYKTRIEKLFQLKTKFVGK